MFDPRNNLANEVSAQLIMHFGDKVFRTIIPRNIRLAEAPSFGKPVLFHDRESRGALAYLALAGEMIRREEEERENAARAATAVATGDNGGGVAVEQGLPTGPLNRIAGDAPAAQTDVTSEAQVASIDSTRARSSG
jgi:hypothetical protein